MINPAETIRELRKKHEISQESLSKLSGVGITTIQAIESGKPVPGSNPTLGLFARLLAAFDCELAIIERKKPRKPRKNKAEK
jgi:transcriptional regulator with XRE-family HTH domain